MYIYYVLHRLFGFTYLFAKQLFFYVAHENLNKIFQGTKIIWRIFQLQTGWLWAFVSQKTVATLDTGDFSHSPTDFLCCTQKTLRTNKNQGVLFSIRKHLTRKIKDLSLCTLFHTVPKLALSATPPADSE